MTKQQIKDYEKVQSIDILKMWIETKAEPEYYGKTLEELPLEFAISDIDTLLDNTLTELQCSWGDTEYRKHLQATARKAKAFLKKYNTLQKG